MRADRVGIALLVGSIVFLVGTLAISALFVAHWTTLAASFIFLSRVPAWRRASTTALVAFVVLLGVGLVGAGVSLFGLVGATATEGDLGSDATMLAGLSGLLAIALFFVVAGGGPARTAGGIALGAAAAGLAALPLGAAEGVLGAAFLLAAVAALVAVAVSAPRLSGAWRHESPT